MDLAKMALRLCHQRRSAWSSLHPMQRDVPKAIQQGWAASSLAVINKLYSRIGRIIKRSEILVASAVGVLLSRVSNDQIRMPNVQFHNRGDLRSARASGSGEPRRARETPGQRLTWIPGANARRLLAAKQTAGVSPDLPSPPARSTPGKRLSRLVNALI